MSKNVTRRLFVKRTGAVTLGSALGLGLVPSVTRKLHAIDTSTLGGVKFSWTDVSVPAAPGLNYPPAAPVGRLEVSVSISSTIGKNVCAAVGTITVERKAVYTETRGSVTYTGTAQILSVSTWICDEGRASLISGVTDSSQKDATIAGGGSSIGTLRSEDPTMGSYRARIYANGEYSPWVSADSGFSASCCALV